MPTVAQYARYREDRTTIWVSKPAAAFLAREREEPRESVGVVLDRLLSELRKYRRAAGVTGAGAGARAGAASSGRSSGRAAGRAGGQSRGASKRGRKAAATKRRASSRAR